ncbi:MAG: hypothetical protein M3470_02635, partial [Chloroflexota bacterium]|nr:hypothetical protein [Chloroflexota bacterium]
GSACASVIRGILATDRRRDGFLLVGLMFGSQPFWLLPGNGNITGYLFAAAAESLDQLLLVPAIAVTLERVAGLSPRKRLPFVLALALSFGPLGWILAMAAVERNGEELAVLTPIAILALVMLGDELARRDERRPSWVSARGEI